MRGMREDRFILGSFADVFRLVASPSATAQRIVTRVSARARGVGRRTAVLTKSQFDRQSVDY